MYPFSNTILSEDDPLPPARELADNMDSTGTFTGKLGITVIHCDSTALRKGVMYSFVPTVTEPWSQQDYADTSSAELGQAWDQQTQEKKVPSRCRGLTRREASKFRCCGLMDV